MRMMILKTFLIILASTIMVGCGPTLTNKCLVKESKTGTCIIEVNPMPMPNHEEDDRYKSSPQRTHPGLKPSK